MVAIDESMKRFDANLHSTYEATRRTALSRFSDGLRANRETITGRQGRAEELDLLKEVFGEDTGLASAKLIAQQWKDTAEYLRLRANAAGMAIPSRKNWNLPQTHNSTLVREAGATEWIRFWTTTCSTSRRWSTSGPAARSRNRSSSSPCARCTRQLHKTGSTN